MTLLDEWVDYIGGKTGMPLPSEIRRAIAISQAVAEMSKNELHSKQIAVRGILMRADELLKGGEDADAA